MEASTISINEFLDNYWDVVCPYLMEYITIPSISPQFEINWQDGIFKAANYLLKVAESQGISDMTSELICEPGLTPVLFMTVKGTTTCDEPILFYGHLDKQPGLASSWDEGLGPFAPVIREGMLYGRGSADDGYAFFAALACVRYFKDNSLSHPTIHILIESAEESGSFDLGTYLEKLSGRLGDLSFIMCLDSECPDYERLWMTLSLRGCLVAMLRVDCLENGIHSGVGGGLAPSSYRVARALLSRVENELTGRIQLPEFYSPIPQQVKQMSYNASLPKIPLIEGVCLEQGLDEDFITRGWLPCLSVVGQSGLPCIEEAGNVIHPFVELKLSFRLPPGVSRAAEAALVQRLTHDPPNNAKVTVTIPWPTSEGWYYGNTDDQFVEAMKKSSLKAFGQPLGFVFQGVSIPFVSVFQRKYPKAKILVTGVLGPNSNAHGPNECLNIHYFKKLVYSLISCITILNEAENTITA